MGNHLEGALSKHLVPISVLGSGEIFGDYALFTDALQPCTVVASTFCHIFVIDGEDFMRNCTHQMSQALQKLSLLKLRQMNQRYDQVHGAFQRITQKLKTGKEAAGPGPRCKYLGARRGPGTPSTAGSLLSGALDALTGRGVGLGTCAQGNNEEMSRKSLRSRALEMSLRRGGRRPGPAGRGPGAGGAGGHSLLAHLEETPGGAGAGGGAFDQGKMKALQGRGRKGKALTPKKEKTQKKEKGTPKKAMRTWGMNGGLKDADLDFSDDKGGAGALPQVEKLSLAERSKVDEADDDFEYDAGLLAGGGDGSSQKGGWFSSAVRSVGVNLTGNVALQTEDTEKALEAIKQKLMSKNVAEEVAEQVCLNVQEDLVGRKLAGFTRVSQAVLQAMEKSLTRLLTPGRVVKVLQEVEAAGRRGKPYVMVFVGVNGVGKSTNLAKIAYWLRQHDKEVMVAACDTFRSGAVEQLRTHCTRLDVELYDRGYEKDPAAVASEAIKSATAKGKDVVLVDTAGRMQDNEPLMRALSKLVNMNAPDLVLFVGEALVGNDAVDQLTKFNQRLKDLSRERPPRGVDGIILTKFDTIDDKVGAALSMVYTSGAPVVFVGCGQTYPDLRQLNVKHIVNVLLQ